MTLFPKSARFLTPLVVLSAGMVLISGVGLAVVDISQGWKSLLALVFVGGAGAIILRNTRARTDNDLNHRSLKRTRAVFIGASVMLASQLVFAMARETGWFGDNAERWTLQWLLIALAAAMVEVLSSTGERKDKGEKDED